MTSKNTGQADLVAADFVYYFYQLVIKNNGMLQNSNTSWKVIVEDLTYENKFGEAYYLPFGPRIS